MNAPDMDTITLTERAQRIAVEAYDMADEALRVRDQHAERVDALSEQVRRLERENAELRALADTKVMEALEWARRCITDGVAAAEQATTRRETCRLTNCGGDVELRLKASGAWDGVCRRCGEHHSVTIHPQREAKP